MGAGYVYFCIIFCVYTIAAIGRCALKKVKLVTEFIFASIGIIFTIAWLIYGNILLYNDSYGCRDNDDGAEKLWKLMLALIIFGYFLFFSIFCLLCCCLCLLCALCGLITGENA